MTPRGWLNLTTFLAVGLTLAALLWPRREAKPDPARGPWWLLIPAALLLWWPGPGFIADDFALLHHASGWTWNHTLRELSTPGGDGAWRPLYYSALALLYPVAGHNAAIWYVLALSLHGLNALLVWRLALRLGLEPLHAVLAGVLYTIHGAQPEAVAWMATLADRLSTLFVLASLLAFAARRSWVAALLLVPGIATKESAYAAPLLAVLWLWHEHALRRDWRRLLPLSAVAALLLAWRFQVLGGPGGYEGLVSHLTPLHAGKVLLWRLWSTLWFPVNLSRGATPLLLAAGAAIVVAGLWSTRRTREGRFAALAVLACSLIPMVLLPVGPDLEKARLLYLPLTGFALFIASLRPPRTAWVLILAAQAVFLVSNLAIWRDVGALTQRTCAAAAACAGAKPAQDMPRVIDGVYFLQFALKDCAGASPIPDKEQRWNADRRELECPTAR